MKEAPESSQAPSTKWEHSKNTPALKQEKHPHQNMTMILHPDLGFLSPDN